MYHITKWNSFFLLDTNCQRLAVSHRKIGCGSTANFLLLIVVAPHIDGKVASICIGECVLFYAIFASLSRTLKWFRKNNPLNSTFFFLPWQDCRKRGSWRYKGNCYYHIALDDLIQSKATGDFLRGKQMLTSWEGLGWQFLDHGLGWQFLDGL